MVHTAVQSRHSTNREEVLAILIPAVLGAVQMAFAAEAELLSSVFANVRSSDMLVAALTPCCEQ